MAYDVGKWALRCPECGEFWDVKELVSPVGTYLSGEKPLSIEQQRNVAAFIEWARKQPGGLYETFSNFSQCGWSLRRMERRVAEQEEEFERLRAETSDLKEERAALRGSIDRLRREEADLRSRKERLEERVGELEQQKEELETKIDVLDLEHFKLSSPEERALFEKWRKDLKERLRTDVEWFKRVTRKHEEED